MSTHLERTTEVPRDALETDDRKSIGIGMVTMLVVSVAMWGVAAVIWF